MTDFIPKRGCRVGSGLLDVWDWILYSVIDRIMNDLSCLSRVAGQNAGTIHLVIWDLNQSRVCIVFLGQVRPLVLFCRQVKPWAVLSVQVSWYIGLLNELCSFLSILLRFLSWTG